MNVTQYEDESKVFAVEAKLDFSYDAALSVFCRWFLLTASLPATPLLCPSSTSLLPARGQTRFGLTLCSGMLLSLSKESMLLKVFRCILR